jgi:hypothetical protein
MRCFDLNSRLGDAVLGATNEIDLPDCSVSRSSRICATDPASGAAPK